MKLHEVIDEIEESLNKSEESLRKSEESLIQKSQEEVHKTQANIYKKRIRKRTRSRFSCLIFLLKNALFPHEGMDDFVHLIL